MFTRTSLAVLATLASGGCGESATDDRAALPRDPAVSSALASAIMTDPDLAGQNQGNALLTPGGPADGSLPIEAASPEKAAMAQAGALALAGGKLAEVPEASSTPALPARALDTSADIAAQLPGLAAGCADKVDYTFAWAARMPAAFPVYPQGHVEQAAGTDRDGCALRVVSFVTPVEPQWVLGFYATLARRSGFGVEHFKADDHQGLAGTKATARYRLFVRPAPGGMTKVDLVTAGA